jgi:hypothetical protein
MGKQKIIVWEYLVGQGVTQEVLNLLGAGGWELVSVTGPQGIFQQFYFKRPKQQQGE